MRNRLADARSDLGSLVELLVLVSVYGLALVMGAFWLGAAIRTARAVSGF